MRGPSAGLREEGTPLSRRPMVGNGASQARVVVEVMRFVQDVEGHSGVVPNDRSRIWKEE